MDYTTWATTRRSALEGMGNNGKYHRKYQFMELNLQRRMAGLKNKIPDIRKTLDTVRFLKLRKVWGCCCLGLGAYRARTNREI